MRKLWDDDSDSGDDAGGVSLSQSADNGFKVNADYAKRFEHNKKREEVQKRTFLYPFFDLIVLPNTHIFILHSGSQIW